MSLFSFTMLCGQDFGQTDQAVNNFLKEIFADAPNFQTKARPLQHGLGFLLPLSAGALFKEPLHLLQLL